MPRKKSSLSLSPQIPKPTPPTPPEPSPMPPAPPGPTAGARYDRHGEATLSFLLLITLVVLLAVATGLSIFNTIELTRVKRGLNLSEQIRKLTEMEKPQEQELMKHYETDEYAFDYPASYTIQPPSDGIKWLSLSKENVRIEIWDPDELKERPIGFSGEETPEEVDFYLPKLEGTLELGKENAKTVRVQYKTGDSQAAKEVFSVLASVRIKK